MNTPTHDEIAQQAQKLWHNYGCPAGRDSEIWLEAERKLNEDPASVSVHESHISPAQTEEKSIQAEKQMEDSRAPQVPQKRAPKPMPAATGKPLWRQPHSS
jgi:hypothetical protein